MSCINLTPHEVRVRVSGDGNLEPVALESDIIFPPSGKQARLVPTRGSQAFLRIEGHPSIYVDEVSLSQLMVGDEPFVHRGRDASRLASSWRSGDVSELQSIGIRHRTSGGTRRRNRGVQSSECQPRDHRFFSASPLPWASTARRAIEHSCSASRGDRAVQRRSKCNETVASGLRV